MTANPWRAGTGAGMVFARRLAAILAAIGAWGCQDQSASSDCASQVAALQAGLRAEYTQAAAHEHLAGGVPVPVVAGPYFQHEPDGPLEADPGREGCSAYYPAWMCPAAVIGVGPHSLGPWEDESATARMHLSDPVPLAIAHDTSIKKVSAFCAYARSAGMQYVHLLVRRPGTPKRVYDAKSQWKVSREWRERCPQLPFDQAAGLTGRAELAYIIDEFPPALMACECRVAPSEIEQFLARSKGSKLGVVRVELDRLLAGLSRAEADGEFWSWFKEWRQREEPEP